MGALTNNRKRGDEYFSQGFLSLNSPSPRSCKKPRLLSDRPVTAMSSKSAVARVSGYPKPEAPLRDFHGPTANHKFLSNSGVSRRRSGPVKESSESLDRNLTSKYFETKIIALEACRFIDKEKEKVSEDSNVEEIEVIELVGEDDDQRATVDRSVRESEGKTADGTNQPSSSSAASDLSNGTLKMESLSLDRDQTGMSIAVYKRLLSESEKRGPKLQQLSFDIEVFRRKRESLQSIRLLEKPVEVTPREAFIKLTKEEEAEVIRALSTKGRKVLVAHENSNIEITGQLMQCLRPGAWLNDEVINVYLELLKEREKRESKKFLKCHFFNTFFYKKISGNGYDYKSVRRWTTQKKLGYGLLDCDKIFVPVHKEIHWCLAVINNKEKKFQYLDSLKGRDNQVMKVLARYYADEVKDKSGKEINLSSWEHEFVEDLPEQLNGFDCGMFMIKYADFYSRGFGLCFCQENMPYFRMRTAKEILRLRAD